MTAPLLSIKEFKYEFETLFHPLMDKMDIKQYNPLHSLIINFVELVLRNNVEFNQINMDNDRFIISKDIIKFVIQIKRYAPILREYITNILIKKVQRLQFYPSDLIKILHCILLILSVHDPPFDYPLSFKEIISQDKFLLIDFVINCIDKNYKDCFFKSNSGSKDSNLCRSILCGNFKTEWIEGQQQQYYSGSMSLSRQFCSSCKLMMNEHKTNYKSLSNSKPSIAVIHSKDIRYVLNRIIYKLYHIYAGNIVYGNHRIDQGHYHYYGIKQDRFINHKQEMRLLLLGEMIDKSEHYNNKNYPNIFTKTFQSKIKQLIDSTIDGAEFLCDLKRSCRDKDFDTIDICFNSKEHYHPYKCQEIGHIYNYVDDLNGIDNLTFIYEIKKEQEYKGYQFVNNNFYKNLQTQIPGYQQSLKDMIFFGPNNCTKLWYFHQRCTDDIFDLDEFHDDESKTKEQMICNEFGIIERKRNIKYCEKQQFYMNQQMINECNHKYIGINDKYIMVKFEYYNNKHIILSDAEAEFYDTFQVHCTYEEIIVIFSIHITCNQEYPTRMSPFIQFETKQVPIIGAQGTYKPMTSKCMYFDLIFNNNDNGSDFLSEIHNLWVSFCNDSSNFKFDNINKSFVVRLINKFKIFCINLFTSSMCINNNNKNKDYIMMIPDNILMYRIVPYLDLKYHKNRQNRSFAIGDIVLCKGVKIPGKIINIFRGQTIDDDKIVSVEILFDKNLNESTFASIGVIRNKGWQIRITPDKIDKIEDGLRFVNKRFYLITNNETLSLKRFTIFGHLVIKHFWESMMVERINLYDLTSFLRQIYCGTNEANKKDKIDQFCTQRSRHLITKYGYYDKKDNKYFMVFIQFYLMYIDLCVNEPNRVWTELCLMDGRAIQHHENQSIILRSTWKNKLNVKIMDNENEFERIWMIAMVDIKLRHGKYCWNGQFLCRECMNQYIEKRCHQFNKRVYGYILKVLCEEYELLNENVEQLFRLLQWILTNECDDNKWEKEFLS